MIQIYLQSIHCHEETDEVGADEPYVLLSTVNLASSVKVSGLPVPLPAFDVVRCSFDDVDAGESHLAPGPSASFWGINDKRGLAGTESSGSRRRLDQWSRIAIQVPMNTIGRNASGRSASQVLGVRTPRCRRRAFSGRAVLAGGRGCIRPEFTWVDTDDTPRHRGH